MRQTFSNKGDGLAIRCVEGGPTVEDAVVHFAREDRPFALESTAPTHSLGRYSILGFDPIDLIEIDQPASDWIAKLAVHVGQGSDRYRCDELPFVGGWVGFIAYEAGPVLEEVACTRPRQTKLPRVRFALYDSAFIYDHASETWILVSTDIRSTSHRLDAMESALHACPKAPPIDWSPSIADEPIPSISPDEYRDRVRQAKRLIAAGDIYQVNLTQRFTANCAASPIDVYRRLRAANPAPMSAYLPYTEATILSSSPELFVSVRGQTVETRPIKGTCPRTADEVMNRIRSAELLQSPKDRAELAMIVDLLRNDLGKVSDYGTVEVVDPCAIEAHPTVYHLVSTVRSRLRSGMGWSDVLQAAFPGGSITGCPKIRAMQIIDQLETFERGVYCGSVGHIGLDGSMTLNIAIRTMVLEDGRVHLNSGGAIVADSDADDEYAETLAKSAGMVRAIRSTESPACTVQPAGARSR
jgi:para-aminobenzoate synthetase component I